MSLPAPRLIAALLLACLALPFIARADTQRAIAAFDRKDYRTAWREFMESAQRGDAEAQAGIGAMLFEKINPPGTGFYSDCEQWLTQSARQGNPKGMTYLARFYYADATRMIGGINPGVNTAPAPPALKQMADRRYAQARDLFERASALGDGYARGNLAIMLDAGIGGPRDPQRAAQLRAGVASRTDPNFTARATTDPGTLAMTANWQAGRYKEALQSAQALAAKGDANAQALLGRAYYQGVGIPRDYAVALTWLNRAVAQNNADGMFILGLMYEHGRGVTQNIPRALQLFDRAAGLGQRSAQMEAKGMRLQGESNRVAALIHANSSVEDTACSVAGGISVPGACIRGGQNIDPWNPYK
jgi:TPR repeat protein